jgi:hypothetical protein
MEAMKRQPRTQFENLKYEVAREARRRDLPVQVGAGDQPYLRVEDHRRLRELVWALIVEGVMTIGSDQANENWPHLSLTEYGEEVVNNPEANPHDVADYLARIRASGPMDEIEERYVTQAIQAYLKGLPDASAVMLGAASEHLIISLIEDIAEKDAASSAAANAALQGKALGMLRFARDYFKAREKQLPHELRASLDSTFASVGDLLRLSRNDAGHPALPNVGREQCFVNLQLYPKYRTWVMQATSKLPL